MNSPDNSNKHLMRKYFMISSNISKEWREVKHQTLSVTSAFIGYHSQRKTLQAKKMTRYYLWQGVLQSPQLIKQLESKEHFTILQHDQVVILPDNQGCFKIWKSINFRLHINRKKIKHDIILLMHTEQESEHLGQWFKIKNTQQ